MQAFGMFGELEDFAFVDSFPFEDRASIVQRVGQDVDLRVTPWHEASVEPNNTVTIIEWNKGHGATA